MEPILHRERIGRREILVLRDEDALSPRLDSPFGLLAWHPRHQFGDPELEARYLERSPAGGEPEPRWFEIRRDFPLALPVWCAEHGDIALSLRRFPTGCGRIGLHLADIGTMRMLGGPMRAKRAMHREMETYSHWVGGVVAGYRIKANGRTEDEGWGYFGDWDASGGALEAARAVVAEIEGSSSRSN